MWNLHPHALRSLDAIDPLVGADLDELVINVDSWHSTPRLFNLQIGITQRR
jgi:hypothetical protein